VTKSVVIALGVGMVLVAGTSTGAGAQETGRWTGLYGGGHGGYAYGFPTTQFLDGEGGEPGTEIEKVYDISPNRGPAGVADCAAGSVAACTYARDAEYSGGVSSEAEGATGGLHAGYNIQFMNVVFGIEGDYDWGDIEGTGRSVLDPKAGALRPGQVLDTTPQYLAVSSTLDELASIRGRLGFTSGALMLYGTGGVAWTKYSAKAVSPEGEADPRDGDPENESGTFLWGKDLSGWVAGGGLEYQFTRFFSLRVEALHYDFGSVGFGSLEGLEDIGVDAGNIEAILGRQDVTINQVRAGGSFHLN